MGMLLIFKIINFLVNNFIALSDEIKRQIDKIKDYKIIIFFKNINFSLLIEVIENNIFIRFPKKKEKVHLLVKLTTRDFIKILFENKNNFRFDLIGDASIAEVFFKLFNFIKSNWKKIVLKKINSNYFNIFLRLFEITKKRILFNKYYLRKIVYENILEENLIVSRYQIKTFAKINFDISKKVELYKEK